MIRFNKKILVSIFIFFIIILISISSIMYNNTDYKKITINKEKIYYEIKYLDRELIAMTSLLEEEMYLDWDQQIEIRTNRLYSYWNSAILDFNILNIDKTKLTDFGKSLDILSVSIKEQNKKEILDNIINTYSFLIIYSENLNYNGTYTDILCAKYNLLISYSNIETGNWTLVHESILKCSSYLSNILNNMDNNEYNQYNINQAYIAVKEMENVINIKEEEIFYTKYNIAINKLKNL